jgi:hypothetical protein
MSSTYIMVCGCFFRDGVGPLHRVEGIMDRFVYKDIVEKTMLPFAKRQMPRGWIYQQDNDPKQTSNHVEEWFSKEKIRVMEWPFQSPDLNSSEHLWEELDQKLHKQKRYDIVRDRSETFRRYYILFLKIQDGCFSISESMRTLSILNIVL